MTALGVIQHLDSGHVIGDLQRSAARVAVENVRHVPALDALSRTDIVVERYNLIAARC